MFEIDEIEKENDKVPLHNSYEDEASFLSKYLLQWMNPILKKGYSDELKIEDIGSTSHQDRCRTLYDHFLQQWEHEKSLPRSKQSLWRVLWRTVGYSRILLGIAYYGFAIALQFGPIIILNLLTRHLQGTSHLSDEAKWVMVGLLFILPVTTSITYSQSNIIMAHIGIQFRNVLVNMIYRKSLRLSPSARQAASTGQIVNMFSNDTMQIQRFLSFFNLVLIAPFQIAACLALIYLQIGPATFVGLGLLLALMPCSMILFVALTKIRVKKMKFTDARVKMINEVLSGIRVIKNYAWETPFEEKIRIIRNSELALLKQAAYIIAIGFTLILMAAPVLQPVLMFYTYVRLGNQLDSARAFTSLSLFNLMQFPFTFLPFGIGMYAQSLVSCRRMLDFFMAEELVPYVDHKHESYESDGYTIKVTDVSASWLNEAVQSDNKPAAEESKEGHDTSKDKPDYVKVEVVDDKIPTAPVAGDSNATIHRSANTLMDISLSVKKGELVAIVGSVGSGKSSFLSALLGELHLKSGYVRVVGSIAYCDQKPWILNATVKDNILFGRPYDEMKFQQAIHAASMEDDIKMLPGGIMTEIGERGINLSGGQKARVALARAVYYDADVYFLDDPLSAVDAHVGQHIFQECIKKTLGDKTRILVTHHVHLLPQCDQIVVLEDGRIKVSGTYEEISNSGIDIQTIVPLDVNPTLPAPLVTSSSPSSPASQHKAAVRDILEVNDDISSKNIVDSSALTTANINAFTRNRSGSNASATRPRSSSHGSNVSHASKSQVHDHDQADHDQNSTSRQRSNSNVSEVVVNGYDELTGLTPSKLSPEPTLFESSSKTSTAQVSDVPDTVSHRSKADELKSYRIPKTSEAQFDAKYQMLSKNDDVDSKNPTSPQDDKMTKILTIEEKKLGDVEWRTYKYYIMSGGLHFFFSVIIFMLAGQGLQIASTFWLAYWGTQSVRHEIRGDELTTNENVFYLNYYAMFSCLYLVAYMIRSVILAEHRLGTSLVLHRNLLNRILGTSIAFFDVTPLGRILNRFTADMNVVDEELSQSISQMTGNFFSVLGALGTITGATKGTFLIIFLPLSFLYNYAMTYFRKSNTSIARLESISRSPIYADFSQALVGLNSIRAYHEQDRFINHLEAQVDQNTIANILIAVGPEWLGIRLDILGSLITFFIAALAVSTGDFIPAGFLALGLSSAFQFTALLKFCVRMVAQFEAQMNAVERIMYYIDNVEQEGSKREISADLIPKDWPHEGVIQGHNLQMRYRDGPLVLKGVDFDVKSHEKVGIAGRTGSGKSSMMIALFRIQELAEGTITIDGLDIATVPLPILRSRLGIIPQDPVMFSATVRFNLDPFNEHSDQALWEVLESVNMKEHVLSLPNKLIEDVAEGGDNFSAGQRQLICIARALLRHPKILVLDEATASIDNDTDALVQVMVREQFRASTVLTIAHRLNTIIDSDRIMVLDAGKLAEYDSAENLLAKPDGLFKLLWDRHQNDHHEEIDESAATVAEGGDNKAVKEEDVKVEKK